MAFDASSTHEDGPQPKDWQLATIQRYLTYPDVVEILARGGGVEVITTWSVPDLQANLPGYRLEKLRSHHEGDLTHGVQVQRIRLSDQ